MKAKNFLQVFLVLIFLAANLEAKTNIGNLGSIYFYWNYDYYSSKLTINFKNLDSEKLIYVEIYGPFGYLFRGIVRDKVLTFYTGPYDYMLKVRNIRTNEAKTFLLNFDYSNFKRVENCDLLGGEICGKNRCTGEYVRSSEGYTCCLGYCEDKPVIYKTGNIVLQDKSEINILNYLIIFGLILLIIFGFYIQRLRKGDGVEVE